MSYYQGDLLKAAASTEFARRPAISTDRARMMERFGLNPATPVNGLMTIFRCASNTTALRPRKLEALLRSHRSDAEEVAR